MSEAFGIIGERFRLIWAALIISGVYAFTMASLICLPIFCGRPRAYHRTLWMLGHLEEWVAKTGRYRKAEGQVEGKRAEG